MACGASRDTKKLIDHSSPSISDEARSKSSAMCDRDNYRKVIAAIRLPHSAGSVKNPIKAGDDVVIEDP
jgi:hypothetical protein